MKKLLLMLTLLAIATLALAQPAGSTVANPMVFSTLPISYSDNTQAYGNNYNSTMITPTSSYLNGNDFVAQFFLPVRGYLSGGVTGSWTGVFIVSQEPTSETPAPVLAQGSGSNGGTFANVDLPAGTYYAIVSTWPAPDYSDFTLNITFTEPLPPISTFPYVENFDSVTAPALPDGWRAAEGAAGASYHWATATSAAHGPAAAHSPSNFAWLYCFLASTSYNPYYLITPEFALPAEPQRLSYYYWIGANTYTNPLYVDVYSNGTWTTLYTHDNTSNTGAWYLNQIPLTPYASSTIKLRFRGMSNYGSGMTDFGIDDFMIDAIPSGPPLAPTLTYPVELTGMPKVGFTMTWTPNSASGPTDWYNVYLWGEDGDVYNADYTFSTINNELNPCAPGPDPNGDPQDAAVFNYLERWNWTVEAYTADYPDEEAWPEPSWFMIQDDPTITEDDMPWCVDFENVPTEGFPLPGWTVHNIDGAGTTWQSTTSYNHSPGGSYAAQHGYASGAQEAWMITPPIELPGNPAMLRFWQYNLYAGDYEYNGVWVTTGIPDPINGTWTELWNPESVTVSWEEEIVLLDAYANDTIHLAFVYEGNFAHTWMVDDICVQLQPTELLAPILDRPIVDAEDLSKTGFDFTWHFDSEGLIPDSYKLYLSQNPANLLTDYVYTGLLDPIFNPTQADINPITFGYDEVWYWTVGAVKAGYDEEIANHRKFTILSDPTVTEEDFPWCVDFENVPTQGFPLPGWAVHNLDGGGSTWVVTNSYNHTPDGTYSALHNYGYTDPEEEGWMITPPIELPQGGWELTFWTYNTYPTYYEYSGVWVTTGNPDPVNGTWTEIWHPTSIQTPWKEEKVSLSAYAGDTIYLAFVYQGYDGHGWAVDDICIHETLEHDVAVTEFISPAGVIINGGSAVVKVKVENLGANPESFQLKLNDGANDYTETVNLGLGASAIVAFENVSIPDYTIATLTATAILSTDQNLDNNEIETVVLALPIDVQAYADVAWDPVNQNAPGPGTFNLKSPGIITDLAPGNPFGDDFLAGADWINGAWLGSEYDDYDDSPWWEIDHVNGATTLLGSCGENLQGIAWNANLDIVYGTDGSSLFTVDKNTGDTEYLGDLTWDGEPEDFVVGLAYDNTNDILYGVSLTWDAVFTIDPTTYEMEPLGWTTGYNLNYAQDMAFDQNTGLLYLSAYDVNLKGMLLWVNTIAPDNDGLLGDCFLVGPFKNGAEIDGFAIPWGYDIITPELEIDSDGTLSWSDTNALYYYIYASNDPYDGYTLLHTTSSTSWLDPSFGEDMKFYYVTTANFAPSSRVTPRIENAHLLPRNGQRLTREVRTIQNVEGRAPKHTPSKNRIQK